MNKQEIIVQISTGGYLEHKVTHDAVCKKLKALLETIAVSKVIIGLVSTKVSCIECG